MNPDALLMPALALVLALAVPAALGPAAEALLVREEGDLGAHWAASTAGLCWVAVITFLAHRWVGPALVPSLGDPRALVFAACVGGLSGASLYRSTRSLPAWQDIVAQRIGAVSGLSLAGLLLVSVTLLFRLSDILPGQVRQVPYDGDARNVQLARISRRAQVDPWDPEVYLARGWHSLNDRHLERAQHDLERARQVGAPVASVAALEADTLAALGRCDEARVAFDRWQRARAAEAMESNFGHELEELGTLDSLDDPDGFGAAGGDLDDDWGASEHVSGPSIYLIDCHEMYFAGE